MEARIPYVTIITVRGYIISVRNLYACDVQEKYFGGDIQALLKITQLHQIS